MLYLVLLAVALVLVVVIATVILRYRKVAPNEVLIVSGRKSEYVDAITGATVTRSFSIHQGGGTFVLPLRERVDVMSVELMTLEISIFSRRTCSPSWAFPSR